jgi:exosortase
MDVRSALPLLALASAAAALYAPIIGGIITQWYQDPVSSHGILLVTASAFVVHRRLPALRALPITPRDSGFAVLGGACVLYILGTLMGDVFVLRLTLPLAFAGVVIASCGWSYARLLAAPMLLLAIAIPLPAIVVTHLTLPLQLVASRVAEATLIAGGIEVTRAGNILTLPGITLEVAEACSGLRSAVSLVAVASVCGAVMSLSAARTILLVTAAIPIAVVGNGFRVAATGFFATWFGEIAARGFWHELTGFVAFVAMCAMLVLVQLATRRRARTSVAQPYPVQA